MFKKKLFLFLTIALLTACDLEKQATTFIPVGNVQDKLKVRFAVTAAGDTVPIGRPIPFRRKKAHPDSVVPPKIFSMPEPRIVISTHNNVQAAGEPRPVKMPEKLPIFTPGKNGVPMPKVIPARGKVVSAIQNPPVPASQPDLNVRGAANFQSLNVKQGLNNSSVRSIFKDSRGYIWLGGDYGLSRYDGTNFTYFTAEEGLSSNGRISSILEDRQGRLWFGTANGVSIYDGTCFMHFTAEESLKFGPVRSMLEDKQGNIWIGTLLNGLIRYDGENFTRFTKREGLIGGNISALWEDKKGRIWIGTWINGLWRYDPALGESGTFTHYSPQNGLGVNRRVHAIFEDRRGNLWFGTPVGAYRYDGNVFFYYPRGEVLPDKDVLCIGEDQKGSLWFGTWGGGASRFDGTSFTTYTKEDGLSNNSISKMWEDDLGRMWFGTFGGGMNRYNPRGFAHYPREISGLE